MATKQARIPVPVLEKADEVQDQHDYATIGEAIRHMCREGSYDV